MNREKIKQRLLAEILSKGMPGWEKIAASMKYPLQIRIGYSIAVENTGSHEGASNRGPLRSNDNLELTGHAQEQTESWPLEGLSDLMELERALETLRVQLQEPIHKDWIGSLLKTQAEPGTLDTLDQALENMPGGWIFLNAREYAKLRRRNPPKLDGLLIDNWEISRKYKTGNIWTSCHLKDFHGAILTPQGEIRLEVKITPELREGKVRLVAQANWGIQVSPLTRVFEFPTDESSSG
ncbi:MAG: hypothetical protein WC824_11285 [Bacteroidota bacterium]